MARKSLGGFIRSLRPLKKYLAAHRRMFLVGLACAFLTNSLGMVFPLVIKSGVDSIGASRRTGLLLSVALLIAIKLVQGLFRFLMRRILIGISRKMEYKIRADLFEHLQGLPLSFYQRSRVGDIMSRATNDLNEVRMLLGPAIMYSFQTAVTVLFALPVMAYIDLKLTVLAFLPLALVSLSYKKVGRMIHERSMQVQRSLSDITAKAQENVAGIRVVKSFTRERQEIEHFDKLNRDYLRLNMDLIKVSGLLFPFMSFLSGLTSLIMLGYGGLLVSRGTITLGDFTAFFIYLAMMYWPMISIGFVLNVIQRGRASLDRIMELFNTRSDITDVAASGAAVPGPRRIEGRLSFRRLDFSYPGWAAGVLKEVSLELEQGETLALVGPVGSGKSTLLSLIPRLYDPPPGTVLIDGTDVRELPLEELRRSVAMVPQDSFLFSESIRENVIYGLDRQAAEEEIIKVVKTAGLYNDIQQLPNGLDTLLGERGINLSGGQKQRTSLSRALIVDAPVLLLDDCFSSVDTHTEEAILGALRGYTRGRTTIMVSHRISTVKSADRIAVIQDGRITQLGSHSRLLEDETGYYASLYEKQLLREKIERIS
ncbi:MAG: ABC transporter ATP-binding protein [Candidatus Glassbacteria bacterium]|nr:ABC transporter ATP-binding protein [Candidatus Glassbacteria bacterium]